LPFQKKSGKEAYLNDEVTIQKKIYICYPKLVHNEHTTQTVYTTYHMQIMNAYIGLIKAQKNLMHRTDGSIIENTFIYEILKRDGNNKEEEMDNFYLKTDEVNIKNMEKRVNSYLQTDMVS
jgi:hypothetical protein